MDFQVSKILLSMQW